MPPVTVELMSFEVRGVDIREPRTTCRTAARSFAPAFVAINARNPSTAVEALTPDFEGVPTERGNGVELWFGRFLLEHRTVRRLTQSGPTSACWLRPDARVLGHKKKTCQAP